ncbi:MAG: sugar ABC transporter permease [Desulfurococcales archaeon]|nr:sugar ABC transporter permease [Desulfurococcales archaeon]
MKLRYSKKTTTLFFLAPALLLVFFFYLLPVVLTIWISFTNLYNWRIDLAFQFIGLENYRNLIHFIMNDPDVSKVAKTTIAFTAMTLVVNVLGGLILAILTFLLEEKISLTFRLLWLLPRMTPIAVFGLLWYYFFYGSEHGTFNSILLKLGLIEEPISWGTEPSLQPWASWLIIVYVNGLVGVSFGMIIFYSVFKSIPRELLIAAQVDGASTLHIVRHILIPMARWHLVFVTVWQLLSLLTTYPHLFVLVEWGVVDKDYGTTWALYVFLTAFSRTVNYQALAAAAAVFLVIIGIILGLVILRIMRFEEMIQPVRGDL